ncbi:MAG: UDP-N-acetylmuramoyl-tripeptide--D-alanyl-D-alanine ligase [Bacteroidales bacterium]|nr:UDP-N-acetylmuramoyl-tripeptide--D-alanyl-D-alanine ligase [Bacteroidales bacterium]
MDIKELYSIYLSCGGRVTTDSRTLRGGELFFALKGENFDGNQYALKALEAGAAYAVVNADAGVEGEKVIPVPDTLEALKDLARYHREHLTVNGERLTVIGLTGTNGKTTTKELIRSVLSKKYKVTATEGNLNNDIGVPLSLLKMDAATELAVIEMGASHPDDILHLVTVAEPDYGLITNVGKAHLLGFGSFEGVKRAKGQLYDYIAAHGKAIFLNADDPDLSAMAAGRGLSTIPYGIKAWDVLVLPSDAAHPYLRMAVPSEEDPETLLGLETHLVGAYNANNVLAALAIGRHFGVDLEDALQAASDYVPANSRSQMTRTERNTLILDAYNANPTSMAAALDNFAAVADPKKVALLGDMRELGADSVQEHVAIVRKLGAQTACLVGEEFRKALEITGTPDTIRWFATSADLAVWLQEHPLSGATVLVKGSRGIQMEKVIPSL